MTSRIIRTSIRWQLLAWFALLLFVLFVGFGITAYQLTTTTRLGQIDDALGLRVAGIADEMRLGPGQPPQVAEGEAPNSQHEPPGIATDRKPPPPPIPDEPSGEPRVPSEHLREFDGHRPGHDMPPPELSQQADSPHRYQLSTELEAQFRENDPRDYFYLMWAPDDAEKKRSANTPAAIEHPPRNNLQPGIKFATQHGCRVAYYYTERQACALVGISLENYTRELHHFLGWLALAGVFILGLGTAGAWAIASRALQPIDKIADAAHHIAAGNLSERIVTSETASELGQLAAILNTTFSQLETAFLQQRQFTADASHEIRTPLAVIIAEAQATLARPRTRDDYRETLETCLEAAQELRKLVESLLELARLDAQYDSSQADDVDLTALAESCATLMLPLAEARSITIEKHFTPAQLRGQSSRIRQVLINLLDNAIHYSYDHGTIRVETKTEGSDAILIVCDSGRGISPEDLPHIFKRFYRAEKARTQTERRAGLGLAIVKAVVDLHRGTINVQSQLGLGTTFIIRLPCNTP